MGGRREISNVTSVECSVGASSRPRRRSSKNLRFRFDPISSTGEVEGRGGSDYCFKLLQVASQSLFVQNGTTVHNVEPGVGESPP